MTYQEDLECRLWKRHYDAWRANPDRQMHQLRKKPAGYDLWLQGDNPLGLALTQAKTSHLISEAWVYPNTPPEPLPCEHREQSLFSL